MKGKRINIRNTILRYSWRTTSGRIFLWLGFRQYINEFVDVGIELDGRK